MWDKAVEIAVITVCLAVLSVLYTGECFADPVKLKLNFLPTSYHHDRDGGFTNEHHRGVGISVTLPNRTTYGLMHFRNSYGDDGFLYSVSTELGCWTICPGLGLGYAPAYSKSDHVPVIGWLSLRYKWVTMLTAPGEVTTLLFSVPLN